MFLFAHLGIGLKVASPWSRGLPRRILLLGTLVPDIIDKSLYYGLSFATGKHGLELGLISGTRTFGHTALLMFSVLLLSAGKKSKPLAALGLGMATHLALDVLGAYFLGLQDPAPAAEAILSRNSVLHAVFWPVLGLEFPVMPFHSATEHLSSFTRNLFFIWAELLGVALLAWEFWKSAHRVEIIKFFHHRRLDLRKLGRRKRHALKKPD